MEDKFGYAAIVAMLWLLLLSNAPNQKRAGKVGDDAWLCSRLLNLVVRLQLIQIERSANSPANRLIFACAMAIPTLVSVKFFAGESRQKSKTSAI